MSRGPARGPLGWAEALSPRVGPGGLPWVLGSSFGIRVSDWPIEGEYSTHVLLESRGSCHFWERAPLTTLRDILSPTHPPCFIDISAMLRSNMADMSLSRGRGRKARKCVRGQVLATVLGEGYWGGAGGVIPGGSVSDHSVEHGEQFTHGGD